MAQSAKNPNVLYIMPDQLRARSLPLYTSRLPDHERDYPVPIETPSIDRLAGEGVTLDDVVATCPVCTPFRAMLMTGRHPQTTGHVINSLRTRWSEISIADAFAAAGYQTGYVGKWHLHTGAWPANNVPDWVPEGRDRLGWQFWRAYNQHMVYFDGYVNGRDWDVQQWGGYETEGLADFGCEFLDRHQEEHQDEPFFLFLSPQPPHFTPFDFAPEDAYADLPEAEAMPLPANVPPEEQGIETRRAYRHYLAMTRMVDRMVGRLLDELDRRGLAENTLVVFASDHGTMGGSHGIDFFAKKRPYEEALHVPFILRLPGTFDGGDRRSVLTAPVDIFPSLCTLCGVPIPRTVEGRDLAAAWRGEPDAPTQDAVLIMNFSNKYDHFGNGLEWRGVRTPTHTYARTLDGERTLFDLEQDPYQYQNLADRPAHRELQDEMESTLARLQRARGDVLQPCENHRAWVDDQRRVIHNAWGPLPHPEQPPDWSLLKPIADA